MGFGGLWQKNGLPACDKCAFVADPSLETGFTLADYPACRVRVLFIFVCKSCWSQAENWYLWCAWEPPCHLSLRVVSVHCLWAAWRCGGCVSGRSMSVTTAALYLSGPGFSWGQGCCTPLCTGAELKTSEASDQTQPVSQLSPALTPRTPVLVSPPLCFSQSLA